MMGRQGRRRRQLVGETGEDRGYWNLKEKALGLTVHGTILYFMEQNPS
jgi:hypothetical protein